ncbi:MAG TPA: AgmX/PglI C-terminal domain-containing protein [Sandaracinaceae bacterium LLY-WYZ-13_1]|nr:AgmX/PglI C-terminal domain-containing protein [Sandaracinaceae bacterium LLY-WYZ-13_1]
MTLHRPKTAALVAYAEDLLSAQGRRRLERHLEGCELCRRELAAIELYDRMVDEAREAPAPAIDFEKMELTLAREARRLSEDVRRRERRRTWLPVAAVAAAAAVLLAMWVGWPRGTDRVAERAPESTPPRTEAPTEAPAPAPTEARALQPVVTLAAGPAHRRVGGALEPLAPGDVLPEGAALQTGEGGELHVRMAPGTGLVARAETRLDLAEARRDAIRLRLGRGAVAQRVAPLSNGSTYVVLAAGHEVEVRGTRFVVSYVEGVVGVDLAEGAVEVRTPAGEAFTLNAPARWRSDGAPPEGVPDVPAPRAVEASDEARIDVTLSDAALVRWQLDGTDVSTREDVRLRLAPGEHEVRAWDARGRLHVGLVPVDADPVTVGPDALEPEAPHVSPGHLEPAEIERVLQRGRRQIQRCYEGALRRPGSQLSGRVRLRVTVGLMGDVRRTRVLGLEGRGADELTRCIGNYAGRWTFPPPGGPVTFEVPLNLTTR